MIVKTVEESRIHDIGHAFGYYDYKEEKGMISMFPAKKQPLLIFAAMLEECKKAALIIFDHFNKNKTKQADEQQKWNQMWSLWEEGQADSPYAELMTYQSEVSNGGHDQYFFNVENTGDLQKEMAALNTILPIKLKNNLERAYKAYLALEEKENDEKSKGILEECDDIFYENEEALNCILREYAKGV